MDGVGDGLLGKGMEKGVWVMGRDKAEDYRGGGVEGVWGKRQGKRCGDGERPHLFLLPRRSWKTMPTGE